MDILLPKDEDITVVAIEAEAVYDFSEQLSPPVEAAVSLAVEAVLKIID
jgi:Ni,Fe-hydrogenase maturation factor